MNRDDRAKRFGEARSWAAGAIGSTLLLTIWGALIPASGQPAHGLTTADVYAYEDSLRNTLVAGLVIGVGTLIVVQVAWSRWVEARRFGNVDAPKRRGDWWAWIVVWPLWLFVTRVFRPFDTVFPIADLATDSGAWFVEPANAARWFIIAAVTWPIVWIAWRALSDYPAATESAAAPAN